MTASSAAELNNEKGEAIPSRQWVWVLPGGRFQTSLVQCAKDLGHQVLVADQDPNAPCRPLADAYFQAGVTEYDKLLKATKTYPPRCFVTDQTDIAVRTVARLCDACGVSGIGRGLAELFTNKLRMREFGVRHNLPVPNYRVVESRREVEEFAEQYDWPLILKPQQEQSSHGVVQLQSAAGLESAWDSASAYEDSGALLCEVFIEGPEFTVEGLMTPSGHHSLAVSIKTHYAHAPTVACGLTYLPSHPNYDFSVLRDLNDKWMNLSGLPYGLTHNEYRYADGRFYQVEMAARGGGTEITSEVVPRVCGWPVQSLYLQMAMGTAPNLSRLQSRELCCAALEFLRFRQGQLDHIEGEEAAREVPGCVQLRIDCQPGELVSAAVDDTTRAGYFIVEAGNPKELAQRSASIHQAIQPIYREVS